MADRLSSAKAPVQVLLPLKGLEQWDREGEPAYDPDGLTAFIDESRKVFKEPIKLIEIDAHINDQAFSDHALRLFDAWVKDGTVQSSLL